MRPPGAMTCEYTPIMRVPVRRLEAFFICGSGKVIHISATSPGAKKRSRSSMDVRRKATLVMPARRAAVAPVHILAPFMSMPMKLREASARAMPTVYSPLPQPSSRTIGRSLPKKSAPQRPRSAKGSAERGPKGYWRTRGFCSRSANFLSLFLPIYSLASLRVATLPSR